ncbi:pyridoxamine 5'-phosphate oxidase [Deinococcus cellulosilyticus]|uniref:Pyridoxine/pyridoxamine 5'-phosphate oxidase n=1 Tax=Deinococcus cellulosilyticus (strain DSM 18568 / NBRC 106333 / KACC 11606 / 5516J-15) TaxID=1223518 RepID=A0A511N5Z8_DEIC1|nr:pyridoxamine 5'-phosphate oxidase [Deinococcus cellulosilyticus]GEM47898.1 pyridoxine/pyridoxamine 5'-phosphate oxidase [Deinococcus cellulosilyticus NBRC 106333 = KACC 11606]
MNDSIRDLRKDYTLASLNEVNPDPIQQFDAWLHEAIDAKIPEPNGMTVSTVGDNGRPTNRVVLLRGFNAEGFVFFTNYLSRKGQDIAARPVACMSFWWPELERQVRIEGTIEKVSPEESDAYFASRPRDSQLSAASSPQSEVIESKDILFDRMEELEQQHPEELPRPEHWGGYRLVPDYFEFWQGGPARLHDRFAFTLQDGQWKIERLAP